MNFMDKFTSPSVARSIMYPALAAASMYIGVQSIDSPMNMRDEYARQYQAAVQSNTNLEKVVAIEKHLAMDRHNHVEDSITSQLQDEKKKLLAEPKTREEYAFIRNLKNKQAHYDLLLGIRNALTGIPTAAFGLLGFFTICNTVIERENRRKRKQQQNA